MNKTQTIRTTCKFLAHECSHAAALMRAWGTKNVAQHLYWKGCRDAYADALRAIRLLAV